MNLNSNYSNIGIAVIDMTTDFVDNLNNEDKELLEESIPPVLAKAKEKNIPIIGTKWGEDCSIISYIKPFLTKEISKNYSTQTNDIHQEKQVQKWIRDNDLEQIIYLGVNANECVLDSINGGNDANLKTFTAYDLIAQGKSCNGDIFNEQVIKATVNKYFFDSKDLVKNLLE